MTTFEGVAGRRARVVVSFGAAGAPAAAPSSAPLAAPPVEGDAPARPWQRPLGYAALGLGGASLVASGIFGGLAISGKNESEKCGTSASCKKTNENAFTDASVSTATFIAGVALAGGGVALVLTAPKARASADAGVRLGATASTSGASLSLGGAF